MWWMLVNVAAAKDCWVPGRVPYVGLTDLAVLTGAEAAALEAQRAANELRPVGPVPANGVVVVTVGRTTIEAAVGANHTVVVESGGVQLVRQDGDQAVPAVPSGMYKHWHSVVVVPIPDAATFPLTVYAIDKAHTHRCAWTVAENGKAKLLPDGG